uniref:C2H2-type domain-containing protein n=1 Tax=Podarcis muralis TaxID=64176 RepID=A0A670JJT9_PODMU
MWSSGFEKPLPRSHQSHSVWLGQPGWGWQHRRAALSLQPLWHDLPQCKLNGSVPELRQPDPAGAGGPPVGCEAPKEESLDGRAAVQQKGEDLPNTSSSPLPSPVVEEKSGQEALAAGQSEERDVCGEACEGLAGLEAHRALHFDQETGKRPFQCDVCERSYKHAGSLINHKQTHKTGLFHCGVCQKQFFNLMALKNHNRTHFETKRYRCPECPKAFRLQKQLASHQRVHLKRHRCPDCGKAFKWQRHSPRNLSGMCLNPILI